MKLYSLALLFAFAHAQAAEENTEATEPLEAEATEPEVEEPKILGGALTWDDSGVVADGVSGTFSAAVTYTEDSDGMVAVQSSADGTWGDVWLDKNNKASKAYEGGILLVFRQEETDADSGETVVMQEGWWGVGARDSSKDWQGIVSGSFQQGNFLPELDYTTFTWNGAPATGNVKDGMAEPNWTDGQISFDGQVDNYLPGVSGSANRVGTGSNSSFKDGEEVTIWGGVWVTDDGDKTVGGAWGAATMNWDLEKPEEKPEETTDPVVEGAANLAMTALAGAALAALAF